MKKKKDIPNTPFSTRLSGSAKETELRLRSIFQWKKKRPPVVLFVLTALVVLLCFGLVSCESAVPEELMGNIEQWIADYPWSEHSENVNQDTRWVVESVKRPNRYYDVSSVYRWIYEVECRSESGASELTLTLLVNPNTLEIYPEPESWSISGKEEPPQSLPNEPDVKEPTQPAPDEPPEDGKQGEVTVAPIDGETLSPDDAYEVRLSGVTEGVSTDGLAAAEFVQICDTKTGNVLWQGDGAYGNAVAWSPDGKRVALSRTTRTGCAVAIIETIGWTAWNVDLPEYTYLPDHGDWIEWTGSTEFRLTMGHGGDAGEEITYHFGPEDFPVAGTSEYSEDTKEVLDFVDGLFAGGRMALWCHLLPGTGPVSASLDGYYEQVREVFARYNWTKAEGPPPDMPHTAESWELWLVDNYICKVDAWSNSNYVVFGYNAVDGSEQAVGYCYDGEPGSLNTALSNLWSGPEFRYALVLLPVKGQDDQTLMKVYETKFREMYLNSGAIDDYKLRELELIPVGEVIGGSQSPFFLMNYSVKPFDLYAPCWKNYTVSEDGWVDISVEVNLSLTGYENAETVWRCGFWQPPNDKY